MTSEQRWLSRRYILYRLLTNMWFIGAVWLYFYRLFINDQKIGILDGMAFAIGLLAEIPSGVLADRFGRDKIVRLGQIFVSGGILIQAFGNNFFPFFIGQAILMIGVSFASGADEALFFDNLKFKQDSLNWRKLVTRGMQVALIGSLVAIVAGGWLHTINPRIPWILTGLVFLFTVIIILPIKDIRPKKLKSELATETDSYIANIKNGFKQFRLPKLWIYVPIIITVQGLFYATGWGLLRLVLMDRFHFDPFQGSVVIAVSNIITVLILHLMNKRAEQISEKYFLTFIALSAVVSLLSSLGNIGILGFLVILVLYAGEYILYPFMSEIINNNSPEKQRATVLSVASFMRMFPYIALAPVIGYLNQIGKLEYFLVGWSILILVAILFYLSLKKRDNLIRLKSDEIIIDRAVE